ncbi:MAG: hypothetical protein GXP33_15055 [Spirochaetes bacterium]|nr:hypothetical protein [Spirochaetota bacterium]
MKLTRRKALLTLINEKKNIGYIPFSTYGVDRFSHKWMADDTSYQEVLEYSEKYGHIQVSYLPYWWSFGLTDILEVEDPEQKEESIYKKGDTTYYHYTLHTPVKDLTAEYKRIKGNMSIWREDNLIKTDQDIDSFLSMPFKPKLPDIKIYKRLLSQLGESGIMQVQMPNPIGLIIENMGYEDFLLRVYTMPEKIDALLEKAQQIIINWLDIILQAGIGESFRICGAEYCAPPMASPAFYHHSVTELDKPIVKMIHGADGIVQYHCHGPISRILDDFIELGVDAIDPCEPSPNGDISLGDIAHRVESSMVIMGNIELDALDRAAPEEIEKLVATAIDEVAGKALFLLMPTSSPFISPLPVKTSDNIISFINAALKYGG